MLMFTCQNPVSMTPDFPPRDRTESLLHHHRGHIRPVTPDMENGQDDGVGIRQDMGREEQDIANKRGFPCPGWRYPFLKETTPVGGCGSAKECLNGITYQKVEELP